MTPQQWEQVKEWFERFSEAPREEWEPALAELEDRVVAEEAKRLLGLHGDRCSEMDRLQPPVEWVRDVAESRAFRAGDVAAERFRIVRFLAAGGMGEVYEAEDLVLLERVALKTLRAELALTESAYGRFKQEIQLSRRVTHRNVCRIHDLWQHRTAGGRLVHFLTMELLDGETLAARLEREGRFAPETALEVVRQIVAGLEAAHAAGVVHRDLKPSNVMITGDRVVVTDFGLSRSLRQAGITVTGSTLGTPAYMAPEQIEGGETGPATDVYSLGVLLYEMVTGVLPFRGGSPMAMAVKKLRETPVPPSSLVDGLPDAWDRAVLRCLAQEPELRFASAKAVLGELEGETKTALPRPKRSSVSRWWAVPIAVVISLLPWNRLWRGHEPTAEAARWYERGVAALHEESPFQARQLLEKAVAADPKYPAAHARLAQALAELDMADLGREELLRAADLHDVEGGLTDAVRKFVLRDFAEAVPLFAKLEPGAGAVLDTAKAMALSGAVDGALAKYAGVVKAEPENAAAWLQVGILQHQLRQTREALVSFAKAEEVFRLRGNLEGLTAVALRRSETLVLTKALGESEAELRRVMEMARTNGNVYLETAALGRLGAVAALAGRFAEAREIAEKAGELARVNGFTKLRAQSLYDLGFAYLAQYRYTEAERLFRSALTVAEEGRTRYWAASARMGLAQALIRQSRTPEALPLVNDAAAYFEKAKFKQAALKARIVRVDARIDEGQNDGAYVEAKECLEEARRVGQPDDVITILLRVGHMAIVRGDFPASYGWHGEARAVYERLGRKAQFLRSLLNEAQLRAVAGDLQEAGRLLEQARALLPEGDANARSKWNWARVSWAAAAGKGEEALEAARLTGAEGPGTHAVLLAQGYLAAGKVADAKREAERAVALFSRQGSPTDLAEARGFLATALLLQGAYAEAAVRVGSTDDRVQQFVRFYVALVGSSALRKANDTRQGEAELAVQRELERLTRTWTAQARAQLLTRTDLKVLLPARGE